MGSFDIIHVSYPIPFLFETDFISELSQGGLIFVWAQSDELALGYQLLNRCGYEVVDQIIWVKSNSAESTNSSAIFVNNKEICLVGYKSFQNSKINLKTRVSNNLLFADWNPHYPLQKPSEIYDIASMMISNGKKLELGHEGIDDWLTLKHN